MSRLALVACLLIGPSAATAAQGPYQRQKIDVDGASRGRSLYAPPGRPTWKIENGYLEVVPSSGDLRIKEKFGDVQLHVEWAAPIAGRGSGQNRGNSGIFLQGRYEVQVLERCASRS